MTFFSSNSSCCFFSFASSESDILYGVFEICPVPFIKAIQNSISMLGGKPGISLKNL